MSYAIIIEVLVAFLIGQTIKFTTTSLKEKKLCWYACYANGGMPSTHSTFAAALTTAVALQEGILSTITLITLGVSLIVIRDAFGVRAAVDDLIRNLNVLIETSKQKRIRKIKYIAGHTPFQVVVGVVLGVVVVLVMHLLFF